MRAHSPVMNSQLFPLRRLFWFAACLLSLSAFATSARAAEADLGKPAGSVTVPPGLSKSEVQDAIVSVLQAREWGVKEKADDRVVGYLKHRSNEATVTLIYTESSVELYCVGYEINKKTGERKGPEQPEGWLKNLKGDLTKYFNRAATQK